MDNPREAHIAEMNRLVEAICKTESPYLKKDYANALARMELELKEYDLHMMKRLDNGRLGAEGESR